MDSTPPDDGRPPSARARHTADPGSLFGLRTKSAEIPQGVLPRTGATRPDIIAAEIPPRPPAHQMHTALAPVLRHRSRVLPLVSNGQPLPGKHLQVHLPAQRTHSRGRVALAGQHAIGTCKDRPAELQLHSSGAREDPTAGDRARSELVPMTVATQAAVASPPRSPRTPSDWRSISGACSGLVPMTRMVTLGLVTPAVRDGSRAAIRRRR